MTVQWQMADQMAPKPFKLILAGETGTGKTHICTTFPGPLFIIPAKENSQETFRGAQIPFTQVWNRASMIAALAEILRLDRAGQLRGRTVCVESLSHHSDDIEDELTNKGKKDMFECWGEHRSHFLEIRSYLDAIETAHVVCTMLSSRKTKRNKDGGQITTEHTYGISGKTGPIFASSFDAIGYCEQVPNTVPPLFRTHFCRYDNFPARTRIRGMEQRAYPNFNFAQHVAPFFQ